MIRIAGDVAIPRTLLSDEDIEADRLALSVPNPARVQAERLGDPRAWRHPERLSLLIEDGESVRYPVVRRDVWGARARAIGATVVDERPTFDRQELACSVDLFPFQARAIDALLGHVCGGLVAPPGSGKGEMICEVVARVGVPALIVVGQVDLANDLTERLHSRLGVTVGRVGAGTIDVQRITVATIQSLDPTLREQISTSFGCVIVDEGHHGAADSYLALSSSLSVRRRYWASATPRIDGLQPFVEWTLGPVRATVTRRELEEAGRAVSPRFTSIETQFEFEYRNRDDWARLLDALVADEVRNELIVSEVAKRCRGGVVGALITGRVAHAEALAAMLVARGVRARTLTGKTSKGMRDATLLAARCGLIDAIVATQLFDEGIDVPRLAVVALAFPAKHEGRLTQRVGRALRVHATKPRPEVLDFVDRAVGVLEFQARKRAECFARTWPTDRGHRNGPEKAKTGQYPQILPPLPAYRS